MWLGRGLKGYALFEPTADRLALWSKHSIIMARLKWASLASLGRDGLHVGEGALHGPFAGLKPIFFFAAAWYLAYNHL